MTDTPNLPLMPCVNCGEFHGGAFEIENGPGPFCDDCWERLQAHFLQPGRLAEFLESREFYELMQDYKHGVDDALEAVKAAILANAKENAYVSRPETETPQ